MFSVIFAFFNFKTLAGAVAGAVATVSSQKVYAYVTKQTASAKAAVAAAEAKVSAAVATEVKKV
jgi:hypothetical protein